MGRYKTSLSTHPVLECIPQGVRFNFYILTLLSKRLQNVLLLSINHFPTALGEVYEWDMENRVCVSKFTDEGTIVGSAIAVTPRFLATGSSSGIVNVYDRERVSESRVPKPLKSLMNLTTRVTSLEANHSGELLCFGSYEKKDVIKLVSELYELIFQSLFLFELFLACLI